MPTCPMEGLLRRSSSSSCSLEKTLIASVVPIFGQKRHYACIESTRMRKGHMTLSHPACAVCLRFFWSLSRAQGHLRYMSRRGVPNRCYEWLRATSFHDSRTWGGSDFTDLPGLKRKEALQLQGPKQCGALETDLEVIEGDFLECRQELKSGGIFFPVADEIQKRCFGQFDWEFSQALAERALFFPQVEGATPGFFLWGMKQDVQSKEFQWFEQVLMQHPQGELLAYLHNLSVQIQRLRTIEESGPHRPQYKGPANDRERQARDLSIPFCTSLQIGCALVPVKTLPLSFLCKLGR